jgi:hypothetical protein
METKHLKGISQRLKRNRSGPSDALRRLKKRPEGNYHAYARMNDVRYDKCDKCDNIAEYKSRVNGQLEYSLCAKCFNERNEKVKK